MKQAIFFLTIIFITNLVGMYLGMYSVWWFDMTLHFLGGFFVAMLMTHYLKEIFIQSSVFSLQSSGIKVCLIILGAVSFIGVVWEFAEYLGSQTLVGPLYNLFQFKAYFIGDLDDTINDLLMDILGALTFLLLKKTAQPSQNQKKSI